MTSAVTTTTTISPTMQRLARYHRLWTTIVPHIPPPAPEDIARWLLHDPATVERAIVETSIRFTKKRVAPDFDIEHAHRYASARARAIGQQTAAVTLPQPGTISPKGGLPKMTEIDNESTTSTITPTPALLDAANHYVSEVEKGSTILAKLPENATHGQLREMIEADHQRLYASAGSPVSHSKGDNEIC